MMFFFQWSTTEAKHNKETWSAYVETEYRRGQYMLGHQSHPLYICLLPGGRNNNNEQRSPFQNYEKDFVLPSKNSFIKITHDLTGT